MLVHKYVFALKAFQPVQVSRLIFYINVSENNLAINNTLLSPLGGGIDFVVVTGLRVLAIGNYQYTADNF